jgi:hypothetical protein
MVQEIRGGSEPASNPNPLAGPGAQERLDRILGREKWHQRGGSWISGAIYWANDGLAAVFGIEAGEAGEAGAVRGSGPRRTSVLISANSAALAESGHIRTTCTLICPTSR